MQEGRCLGQGDAAAHLHIDLGETLGDDGEALLSLGPGQAAVIGGIGGGEPVRKGHCVLALPERSDLRQGDTAAPLRIDLAELPGDAGKGALRLIDAARPSPEPSAYDIESGMNSSQLLNRWDAAITEASQRFHIPQAWIRAVMRQESGGRTMLAENRSRTRLWRSRLK